MNLLSWFASLFAPPPVFEPKFAVRPPALPPQTETPPQPVLVEPTPAVVPADPAAPAVLQALLEEAEGLAWLRPLAPYPAWRFDGEWDNPDERLQARRRIWSHFRDHRLTAPVVMPWYRGLRVQVQLGNDTSKQLFIAGCTEPNEFAFVARVLRPGMVFVDAGANEGLFTLLAAGCVGPQGASSRSSRAREQEACRRTCGSTTWSRFD